MAQHQCHDRNKPEVPLATCEEQADDHSLPEVVRNIDPHARANDEVEDGVVILGHHMISADPDYYVKHLPAAKTHQIAHPKVQIKRIHHKVARV